jgi:NDP-sugar pyrophosphorylase family protein
VQAVILAGGLATRLGVLTEKLPKSLLPVAGRPFLAWQLERIESSGFRRVVLCVGHLGDEIERFAGDGKAFGLDIRYSHDGPRLLGTGGALRRATPLLEPSFVVTYGDSYLPFDHAAPWRDLQAHPDALGTMSVFLNRDAWDASNAAVEGEYVVAYDKAARRAGFEHIDYGATALRRAALEAVPEGERFGLDTLFGQLAAGRMLRACPARERFYEIGSEAGLTELDAHLRGLKRQP